LKLSRAILLLGLLTGFLALTASAVPPARAQERPTPTVKACHICDEGLLQETVTPQPVVHAVLFWMDGCPHCHEVLDNVLPPLQEKYGAQLDILLVEVITLDDVNRLYEVAAAYDIPRERVGVPFLIVGDHVLIGSRQIPDELPGLIERYLAQGGVDWPEIPNLNEFLTHTTSTPFPTPTMPGVIVRATLFTTLDCRDCQLITAQVLWPLQERYGNQFEVQTVDVVTSADVEYVYQVAAGYGLPKEAVNLPLLIIGDQVLMTEEIPAKLPNLVDEFLQKGGTDFPSLPPRRDATITPTPAGPTAKTETGAPAAIRSNGFAIAIGIMILMAAALIYSLIAFAIGKTFILPPWGDWLIPILVVIGMGVAGYLSYVETQSVEAVCGPVGDCNAVQQSRYAKLFDVLPVGVLGLLGYLGLIAAWLARRFLPKLEKPAAIGYWGMAFFAVIFSLYLTYLEPFVIKAVCIWCLASAVIVTLLLLLGTPPAVLQFTISDEDE
jgi:uncharacterized membrane protein/thiol-disulfide isomerase/thioredoxin